MKQPTATIDTSVLHAISELDQKERDRIWNELRMRFQIVIPWVLIEEVWTNYGSPGEKEFFPFTFSNENGLQHRVINSAGVTFNSTLE